MTKGLVDGAFRAIRNQFNSVHRIAEKSKTPFAISVILGFPLSGFF